MLEQLTKRVWLLPGEEETDRPYLYYIRGGRRSLAVDAGNSPAHVEKFYRALGEQGLPLPDYTVLTHWHWDHTFGGKAVNGLILASERTNRKLEEVGRWQWTDQAMTEREQRREDIPFCNNCIRREYLDLGQISVITAEVEIQTTLALDLGGVACRLFCRDTPHSRDGLLVYVPQEGLLALGDAHCGDYYEADGGYDLDQTRDLYRWLAALDVQLCLPGHHVPISKGEILDDLQEQLPG